MSAFAGKYNVYVEQPKGVSPGKELLCTLMVYVDYLPYKGQEILQIDGKYYRMLDFDLEVRKILIAPTNIVHDITTTKNGKHFLLPRA